MTALSDRIAAEHELHPAAFACQCGQNFVPFRDDSLVRLAHAEHLTGATEQAVMDAVAQQLEAARPDLRQYLALWKRDSTVIDATTADEATTDVLDNLTRIAREGTRP